MAGCGEDGRKARPGGDSNLRKDPLQVVANGSVRQIEPGTDNLVRMPLGRELGNVQLLRGQVFPNLCGPGKACLACCSQFFPRAITPGRGAERVKNIACLAQRGSRISGTAPAAKPGAVAEQETPSQEGPVFRGRPKAFQEESFGFF